MAQLESQVGGLKIRAAVREDRAAVSDLFARAEPDFPLEREAYGRQWDWLHWQNAVRPSDILVGVEDHGALQGHVAMLPVSFSCAGQANVVGWPCQLMVDQRWRRSLLYPTLVQRLLKLCRSGSFVFAYALIHRHRVLQANSALGLKPIGTIPVWARPYRPSDLVGKMVGGGWGKAIGLLCSPGNLLARMLPPRRIAGIVLEAIDRFEPEIDALFETTMLPAYRYVANRTAETLNWRFFGLPERRYHVVIARAAGRIVGYVAFRTMPMKVFRALAIADVWYDPAVPAAGEALMAALHRAAIAEKVDLAACLMPRHSPMAKMLRRFWFWESPESFTLTVYQPRADLPYGGSPITDWHPTWYDHDYV